MQSMFFGEKETWFSVLVLLLTCGVIIGKSYSLCLFPCQMGIFMLHMPNKLTSTHICDTYISFTCKTGVLREQATETIRIPFQSVPRKKCNYTAQFP